MDKLKSIIENHYHEPQKDFQKKVYGYLKDLGFRVAPDQFIVHHKDDARWVSLTFLDPCPTNPIASIGFSNQDKNIFKHAMRGGVLNDEHVLSREALMFKDRHKSIVLHQIKDTFPYSGGGSEFQIVLNIICFDDDKKANSYLNELKNEYMVEVLKSQWNLFADSMKLSQSFMTLEEQAVFLKPCLDHPVFKKMMSDLEERVLQSLIDDNLGMSS